MLLTVAVNSYKNTELLRLCLESIERSVSNIEGKVEVIVADSATEEDTEMLMREEFPHIRFFPNKKNVGFVGLANTCLREARGEYVFLLNYDVSLGERTLVDMLAFMQSHKDVGLAGPKLMNFDGSLQYSCFHYYRLQTILYRRTPLKHFSFAKRHLDWFVMKGRDHTKALDVDWIMGSALFVRSEAVKKVGDMDRRFFMYMEDVDWCRRFWEQGYRVTFFPGAQAYHYYGKGSAKGGVMRSLLFNKLTWIHIASAWKYFWKYWGKENPRMNSFHNGTQKPTIK